MGHYDLLRDAIDIHIHMDPDPNHRRRVNAYEAAIQARDAGMRAIVLKSHDYGTAPLAHTVQPFVPEIEIYGGVALDFAIGGLNPAAVEVAGKLKAKIVWMPTFSSEHNMKQRKINKKGITILTESGEVFQAVREILELIKQYDMSLATGHISTRETFALLDTAQAAGIERIIITHPMSITFGCNASIEEQKQMVECGAFIEHCFISTMPTSDRVDPRKLADAMRAVGPEHCIMSTDFGQIYNPPPVEGMRMFIETMLKYEMTEDEVVSMVKTNPARVLGLTGVRSV